MSRLQLVIALLASIHHYNQFDVTPAPEHLARLLPKPLAKFSAPRMKTPSPHGVHVASPAAVAVRVYQALQNIERMSSCGRRFRAVNLNAFQGSPRLCKSLLVSACRSLVETSTIALIFEPFIHQLGHAVARQLHRVHGQRGDRGATRGRRRPWNGPTPRAPPPPLGPAPAPHRRCGVLRSPRHVRRRACRAAVEPRKLPEGFRRGRELCMAGLHHCAGLATGNSKRWRGYMSH